MGSVPSQGQWVGDPALPQRWRSFHCLGTSPCCGQAKKGKQKDRNTSFPSLPPKHLLSYTWPCIWVSECKSASLYRHGLLERRLGSVSQSFCCPSGPAPSASLVALGGSCWIELLRILLENLQSKIGKQGKNHAQCGIPGLFPWVPEKVSDQVVASHSGCLWLSMEKKWCWRKRELLMGNPKKH